MSKKLSPSVLQIDMHALEEDGYSSFSDSEDERAGKQLSQRMGAQTEMHPWHKEHPAASAAGKIGNAIAHRSGPLLAEVLPAQRHVCHMGPQEGFAVKAETSFRNGRGSQDHVKRHIFEPLHQRLRIDCPTTRPLTCIHGYCMIPIVQQSSSCRHASGCSIQWPAECLEGKAKVHRVAGSVAGAQTKGAEVPAEPL